MNLYFLIEQKRLYWLSNVVLSFIVKCIQSNLSFNSMDRWLGEEPERDRRSSRKDPLGPNRRLHTYTFTHPHLVIFTKRSRNRPLGPNRRLHTQCDIPKAQEKSPLGLWPNVKERFVDEEFNHISLMLQRPSLTFWKYWYIKFFCKMIMIIVIYWSMERPKSHFISFRNRRSSLHYLCNCLWWGNALLPAGDQHLPFDGLVLVAAAKTPTAFLSILQNRTSVDSLRSLSQQAWKSPATRKEAVQLGGSPSPQCLSSLRVKWKNPHQKRRFLPSIYTRKNAG